MALTGAQKQERCKQKKRDAGLEPMEVWARPIDKPRIKNFTSLTPSQMVKVNKYINELKGEV